MRIKNIFLLSAIITGVAAFIFCTVFEPAGIAAGSPTGKISGIVVDNKGPVAGASVRVQGSRHYVVSDTSGNFTITGVNPGHIVNISAWKQGYYNALRRNITIPASDLNLTLVAYQINDNPAYTWLPPEGKEVEKNCASCHPVITEMSLRDAHLNSARNPRFLTMYYGTDIHGNQSPPTRYVRGSAISAYVNMLVPLQPDLSKPYYGPGYRLDFPDTTGDCSSCHIPGASLRGNIDPASAKGADKYGVHCDFCHKIANVCIREKTLMPVPRVQGSAATEIRRPFPDDSKRSHLFFGTFEDVNADEGDINLPLLKESRYCASCHFGVFWNTVIYNSRLLHNPSPSSFCILIATFYVHSISWGSGFIFYD